MGNYWICPNCDEKNLDIQISACWECDWPYHLEEQEEDPPESPQLPEVELDIDVKTYCPGKDD